MSSTPQTFQPVSSVLSSPVHRWKGSGLALLCVLNAPLMAEPVRKYLVQSNAVLASAELCVVACAVFVFVTQPRKRTMLVLSWLVVTTAWALATVALGHHNLMLGAVGLRAIVVGGAVLVLSAYLFSSAPVAQVTLWLYRAATFWLAVMGIVAAFQLLLGPSHPINELAEELGADKRHGVGDFAAEGVGLEWLFRPTSVFLHTGKFGQVAFVLATFCLFYRTATKANGVRNIARILGELTILVVSGQRAAILGYMFALLLLQMWTAKRRDLVLYSLFASVGGAAALISYKSDYASDVVALIGMRVWSGVTDIPLRLLYNLLAPAGEVAEHAGLFGVGAGAYSLGSNQWGGRPLYEVITVGVAENSWLRIMAELGWPGLLLVLGGGVLLIIAGIRHLRVATAEAAHPLSRRLTQFNIYVIVVLSLWAITHDVLGSTTTVAVALAHSGWLLQRLSRSRWENSP